MPYLIDGHNLIPKIPGMSLRALDDEEQLIELLQTYARLSRQKVEVFFDKAPVGQARAKKLGMLVVRFVSAGRTADEAILAQLMRLGKEARNWTVVSSDHRVQTDAKALLAKVMPSEGFVKQLLSAGQGTSDTKQDDEVRLKEGEVEEWLNLFNSRHSSNH
jgi:predicted RNA-binding protein with PIN domain